MHRMEIQTEKQKRKIENRKGVNERKKRGAMNAQNGGKRVKQID